jgi:hypothetical protein
MNWFISNRDLIKNLAVNTGTSLSPVYTTICTTSEISINTDLEEKDFYVFCDSLQRKIITGASVELSGTIKLDVNNTGVLDLLGDIHTLLASGTIAQFNNKMIKFDLLTNVSSNTLEYTTYTANATLSLSDLGGAAEDESEFSFEMQLIGKATEITSS